MSRPSTPGAPLLARTRCQPRCRVSLSEGRLQAALRLPRSGPGAGARFRRWPDHAGLHSALGWPAPLVGASDAFAWASSRLLTLPLVRSFAEGPLATTTTSADLSLRLDAIALSGARRDLPREDREPSRHDHGIDAVPPWSRGLGDLLPARPARRRLISGFCPSARSFACRGPLTRGLPPPRSRPC
jgi:hypothetical protein